MKSRQIVFQRGLQSCREGVNKWIAENLHDADRPISEKYGAISDNLVQNMLQSKFNSRPVETVKTRIRYRLRFGDYDRPVTSVEFQKIETFKSH